MKLQSDDNVIAQLLDEEGGNRWWVIEKINARRHGKSINVEDKLPHSDDRHDELTKLAVIGHIDAGALDVFAGLNKSSE